jgi:hypothetical protein
VKQGMAGLRGAADALTALRSQETARVSTGAGAVVRAAARIGGRPNRRQGRNNRPARPRRHN